MLMLAAVTGWQADAVTSDQPPPRDDAILRMLQERDGMPSQVVLSDGETLTVFNIAWGYDFGDEFAHVTTNISPLITGQIIDFFSTESVKAIVDPATDTILLAT